MKSLEDFESMTVPQLKGIATSLGVNVPANIKKPDLVKLVFDVQQPDAEDPEAGEKAPEPDKEINTQEVLEAKLQEIADHYEGEIKETEDKKDGATVYIVSDMAGDEIARGTFQELYEHVKAEGENTGVQEGEAGGAPGLTDVPLSEDFVDMSSPAVSDADNQAKVEEGLKALTGLGLRYSIDGSVVKLEYQSKIETTTLNQPAYRVVRVAEALCNFR